MRKKTHLLILLMCFSAWVTAQVYEPTGIAISGKGPKGITVKNDALWISFLSDNKVSKVSLTDGTVLANFTAEMNKPSDVDCDASGRIFVANQGTSEVLVLDEQGSVLKKISLTDMTGNPVTGTLNGVTVNAEGKIFVSMGSNAYNAIHVFDTNLNQIQVLTTIASNSIAGCDKFRVVRDVFFDKAGSMFIIDQNTGVIKVASYADNKVIPEFLIKKEGSKNAYNNCAGLAETLNGNLILSLDKDKKSGSDILSAKGLYQFTPAGVLIGQIPSSDSKMSPYGVAVDAQDNLFIADNAGGSVLKWKAVDNEAPVVSSLGLSNVTRSSVDVSLQVNEAATIYWKKGEANVPLTAAQVKSGNSFEIAESNVLVTKSLGVGSVINLRIYLLAVDKAGNESEVLFTDVFTTNTPLELTTLFPVKKTADAVTMEVVPNDKGTIYWMLSETETTPSAQDVENAVGAVNKGTVEVIKGGESLTFDVDGLLAKRYYLSVCLKSNADYSEVVSAVVMPKGDAETIYQRYFTFLIGDNPDYTNPEVLTRYQALRGMVATARKKLADHQWTAETPQFDLSSQNTESSKQLREVLGQVLLPLAMNYQLQGPADQLNPDYHQPQALAEILGVYDYLEKRGFKQGSALQFGTSGPYLGLAGYFYANILMREELMRSGLWQAVSDNMMWCTRMVTDETTGLNSDNVRWGLNTKHNGTRSDGVRTIYHNRLVALACLGDEHADREDLLDYLHQVLEINLSVNSAWDGFIKPDYTGYHHNGVWGNAYNIDALNMSCQMALMLHNTSYAMSQTTLDNLANSLLAFRQYSGKYDISRGLCGRFPNQLNTLLCNMPAFAFLYQVLDGDMQNRIGGAFCRLYEPAYSGVVKYTLQDVKSDIYFHGGMQVVQLMNDLKAKNLTDDEMSESNCTYPYAAMQVHRRNDWMAAVKGYSKYIWDFETNGGQNWIGRNQSAGGLSIYATKDAEGVVTAAASGLGYNGWDWVHVPGATVLNMSIDDIVAEAKNFQWARFSPQYFVGGVSLEGKQGLYSMIYDDARQKNALKANKSYFFFDDEIVALGSSIQNTHATYDAHTTLFQNELATADTPLYLDGEEQTGLATDAVRETDDACYLTDAVGNGYVLPHAKGLHLTRAEQVSVKDGNTSLTTKGNYAKAWLDHGKAADGSYEYLIYVGGAEKVKTMSGAPTLPYTIQQQDGVAHIVYHAGKNLKGYSFFQIPEALDDNYIATVSEPCMAMLHETAEQQITLSVANPELGFYPKDKFPFQVWKIDADKMYLDSEEQPVDVTLHGEWTMDSAAQGVELLPYDDEQNQTVVRFHGKDAQSLEVALTYKTSAVCLNPADSNAELRCYPCPFTDWLTVEWDASDEAVHTVQLCDISGRLVSSTQQQGSRWHISVASLPVGTYLMSVDGQVVAGKLVKR